MYSLIDEDDKQIVRGKGQPKEILKNIPPEKWREMQQHSINKDIDEIEIVTAEDQIQQKVNFINAMTHNKNVNEVRTPRKINQYKRRESKKKNFT